MTDSGVKRSVGIVSYDYDPSIGGLGILAKLYVSELASLAADISFSVLSPSPGASEHASRLARLRWNARLGCPLFSLTLLWTLPSFIRRRAIDLVHVHAGSGGVFLLRRPSCRLLVMAHHTYSQECRYVFQRRPLIVLWKRFMSILERRTYRLADRIVCVSDDTRQELISAYGISPSMIVVIENPVPADLVGLPRALPGKRQTIVCVGRLEQRKGTWVLLEAFRRLHERHPELRLRLIGRNLLGASVGEFLRKHSLSGVVSIEGHRTDRERFLAMAEASAVVVPSLLEGFGLVAAESMLLGACTVVSDSPGLRSLIHDRVNGRIFRSGDPASLVEVLTEIMDQHEEAARLGRAASAEAQHRFDRSARSRDLLAVYESLIRVK